MTINFPDNWVKLGNTVHSLTAYFIDIIFTSGMVSQEVHL